MLYDSPHAQEKVLGRNFRRISHGPAIRHHQPLRPGLQLGRNHRWPSRNVDRRRSLLCSADGRLALARDKIGGITHEDPPLSTRNYPLRYAGNLVSYGPTTKLPNLACSPWRGLDRLASLLNLNGRGSQVGPVCLCRRVTRRLFQSE